MQSNDQILSLNGESPAGLALYQFEDVLSNKAATTIKIRYLRDAKEQQTTLSLRELLPLNGELRAYQK